MIPYNLSPVRPFEPVMSVPLDTAIICLDCERVTESGNCHCVVCGSRSILTISRCRVIPMDDKEISAMNEELRAFEERRIAKCRIALEG